MEILKIVVFSGFFVLLGSVVWKRNIIDFIAGYNENAVHNPRKLSKNIGIIIILFGIEIGILMFLNLGDFAINPEIIGVLVIIHIITILLCYVYDTIERQR